MKEITPEKITKYLDLTSRAVAKCKIVAPDPSYAHDIAVDFKHMAESYLSDAHHFAGKGDFVNAFACVNYAHGWLDSGARLGVFDVSKDDVLFTLRR